MSFYTSLKFYRPTKPPLVTGRSLANFLRSFVSLGLLKDPASSCSLEVKFGPAIDQDDRPSEWMEPILKSDGGATIEESREIEWDLKEDAESAGQLAELLESHKSAIYRAFLLFGCANEGITRALTREPSAENSEGMCLWDWSIELGPVQIEPLGSDSVFQVGWLGVSIGGNGYSFPWTIADLLRRAENQPDLIQMKGLCRQTCPVPSVSPEERQREGRRLMTEFWPYPIDQPMDWFWGVSGS